MRASRVRALGWLLLAGVGCLWLGSPSSPRAAAVVRSGVTGGGPPVLTEWIVNAGGIVNPHWPTTPVNVQSVTQVMINGVPYAQVRTNSIADYFTTMSAQLIQELNGRPRAATDFRLGHTSAQVGQVVRFGDDIGYNSPACAMGYWPPGPSCPSARNRTSNFPIQPIRATTVVSTGLGAVGLWVDGTAVYNWSDGQSYQNGQVWRNTAMEFEVYDMDICPGHAAMGDYHHHSYSACIAELVGDTGQGHSPIYGFANDGYPIYGPWVADGVLARSGWTPRDYDDPGSLTGCGVARVRNCLLRNPLDPSQGTMPASQTGPRTDANVTTLSGNVISATSGVYFQDYWYDSDCADCLDANNGHEHDGMGYHYHVTQRMAGGGTRPAFPYTFGPRYAGVLNPNVTPTPTFTVVAASATPTRTNTATDTPVATATETATPTPAAVLVGHVTWQGPPQQPSAGQELPVTLTLKLEATEVNYPAQNTDASGYLTVSVAGLGSGVYSWRAKGPKYLAGSGSTELEGAPMTSVEMGLMRAGDANDDNVVALVDFSILKGSFGKALGDPGYDGRADFTNDNVVGLGDFNLLKGNFGQGGAPPVGP